MQVSDPLDAQVIIEIGTIKYNCYELDISNIGHSIIATIKKPNLLIQVSVPELARYYFKIIDEKTTLLITAYYMQIRWTTKELFENPTESLMTGILQHGIRLL